IVGDGIGLADAVWIAPLGDDEILRGHAARIAQRQREAFDWMANRPPHLNDGEAALQQALGLLPQEIAHALRPRPFGVVVVNAADDLAQLALFAHRIIGGAQRVVEDDDARRAGLRLDQRFHLRIVDAANLLLIEEVAHRRIVPAEPKAVGIEREAIGERASIVHDDAARIGRAAGADIRRARSARIGEGLLTRIAQIIDLRLDRLGRDIRLRYLVHREPPRQPSLPYVVRRAGPVSLVAVRLSAAAPARYPPKPRPKPSPRRLRRQGAARRRCPSWPSWRAAARAMAARHCRYAGRGLSRPWCRVPRRCARRAGAAAAKRHRSARPRPTGALRARARASCPGR